MISHSKHHLHSYYVIRNSELVGFTDPEIELIAQVARYHRKSAPKPSHPTFAALDPDAATHRRGARRRCCGSRSASTARRSSASPA